MYEDLWLGGKIIVDDVVYVRHVNTASCDISDDEDPC
jgi:hypothetical protein